MSGFKFYKMWTILVLSFMFVLVVFSSCGVNGLVRYTNYSSRIERDLPDSFRIQTPFTLREGLFTIDGKINQKNTNFIIDTGAEMNLAKIETLEAFDATFWGNHPAKSVNAYGQKSDVSLYYPNSLEIQGLLFERPLFEPIYPNNQIHNFLSRPVLGADLIKTLYWKFSMDNQSVVLFGKKDKSLLEREVKGYTKIEMGWMQRTDLTILPMKESCRFIFDLGFNGEIRVDKQLYAKLSNRVKFKKYLQVYRDAAIDTVFLSEHVNVRWGGIEIKDCRVVHSPRVNYNFLGSRFMQRFNFVLAFESLKKTVYIKPSDAFGSESTTSFSDFGFDISEKESMEVAPIEIDGLAEAAGLKLRDRVLSVDNGTFDLSLDNRHDRLIQYLRDKSNVSIQVERDGEIIEIQITKE